SYDVYLSSGGPGSPLDSKGSDWEEAYFGWLHKVLNWNQVEAETSRKYVFFICHSYQLACRHFGIGNVCKRKSTAFGVFPIHELPEGAGEPVFHGLREPFYGVDSRDYQVIEPDFIAIRKLGATVLAIEKDRPHVPFQRAVMAVRFNRYMIGTQFHPEADAIGMSMYLQREDKKQTVIAEHGEAKWESMIVNLNDPDKIMWTYAHVIPNFLDIAIEQAGKIRIHKKVG
ncbi:MAG: GMP synthase, partial [Chitinophagaceae bacterium]